MPRIEVPQCGPDRPMPSERMSKHARRRSEEERVPCRCPHCGNEMTYVRTILRALLPNIEIWYCEQCDAHIDRPAPTARR